MFRLSHRSAFGGDYVEFTLANLAAGELAMMVARGLAPMTAAGFLTHLSDELVDDVYQHIQTPRLRVILDGEESLNPVAFMASRIIHSGYGHFGSDNLYYLGGMIVGEQHRGIGGKLLHSDLKKTGATHIGLHTQSLRMLGAAERLADHDFQLADIRAESLGTPLAKKQYRELPGRGMSVIHSHRYGSASLYGDLGTFYRKGMQIPGIDPASGDAVVYVGRVK